MGDKPVTLVVSDLHLGGGPDDRGDDHVFHDHQFERMLHEQLASPDGRAGRIELFVNGDFLEFAQTATQAFELVAQDRWCTEQQSLAKLLAILRGHAPIFRALEAFQAPGNVVTLAAGNHDVDLYWPRVQQELRRTSGSRLRFEIGHEWVARHAGALQIAHGHLPDVANTFRDWRRPIVPGPGGIDCLEMCPGTLFMVKFVNQLEAQYPFADNLLPVTKLAQVLLQDDKRGFMSVGWLFSRMVLTTDMAVLGGRGDSADAVGRSLLARFRGGSPRRSELLANTLRARGHAALAAQVGPGLAEDALASIMMSLLGEIEMPAWLDLFDVGRTTTLGDDSLTLSSLARAGQVDGKQLCRTVAGSRAAETAAQVVVMGHTHQPDECVLPGGARYFNPGSWTRYLELAPGQKVTLDDLRDESRYPYRLNVVRVEAGSARLAAVMSCVDSWPGTA